MPTSFYLREGDSIFGWLGYLFWPAPGTGFDELIGRWAAALLTLAIFSFIFRDNPLFKLAEHVFIGVGTGYQICRYFNDAIYDKAYRPLFAPDAGTAPDAWVIIPAILGAMTLLKIIPQLAFWSRWPIAFVAGVTMGLSIITYLQSNVVTQIEATIKPFRFLDEAVRDHIFMLVTPDDSAKLEAQKRDKALESTNGLSPADEQKLDADYRKELFERRRVLVEGAGLLDSANPADRSKLLKLLVNTTQPAFKHQDEVPIEPVLLAIVPKRDEIAKEIAADNTRALELTPKDPAPGAAPSTELAAERAKLTAKYGEHLAAAGTPDAALPVETQLAMTKTIDHIAAGREGVVPKVLEVRQRDWLRVLNAFLIGLGTLAGLVYFFFSKEHTGIVFGGLARIGIWFLMIAFGGSFGFTVMGRISLLIGRIQFLLGDWLHLSGAFSGVVPNW